MQRIIKFYVKILALFSKNKASNFLLELFQKTQKVTVRERELPFYIDFKTIKLEDSYGDFEIVTNDKNSTKTVLLVHGWNSNAGSMQSLAKAIDAKGLKFYAVNFPAHGYTQTKKTNIAECKERLAFVLEHFNLNTNLTFLSHSFGSAVTTYLLSTKNISAENLIFLTSPNAMAELFKEFTNFFGLDDEVYNQMLAKGEQLIGDKAENLDVAKGLRKAKFKKLTLIHDENDKVIPIIKSEEIKAENPSAELLKHHSIGHYRMLSNQDVIKQVLERL